VYVRRTDQGWAVEINPGSVPRLRVNQDYASLVSRSGDYATLRAQLQEARWLIRSLEIRKDTLLRVARTIVQRQAAFLERGDEAMQPMILRDVAEAVGMHESTISRVTTGKYMLTPRGIYEFRFFFSSHVAGAGGEDVSSVAIRARIRKLIADEDSTRPLSDAQLAQRLSGEGVKVARRTVAKYREAIGLASSGDRRHAPDRARA
jgi:RNA polymerase sigma-54 factor